MFLFFTLFFTLLLVFSFLLFLCLIVMIKFIYSREKYSVFECGFDLLSCLRLPFSLHFYIISIIFLIFDVELVLLLPFVFLFKFYNFFFFFFILLLFFFVFVLGFFYEWWGGLLGWLV